MASNACDNRLSRSVKALTFENFLDPDTDLLLPERTRDNGRLQLRGAIRTHVERFTRVGIPDATPENIRCMFETAKAAMVYGVYYYPLYTLGCEHLCRLFELVVSEQYAYARGPSSTTDLKAKVQWLVDSRRLHGPDRSRWIAMCNLRTVVSHPGLQAIVTPNDAATTLERMRELIDELYPDI